MAQVSKAGKHHVLGSLALDGDLPPAALPVENAPPASAVIARLGDLERLVHLQLALTEGRKAILESAAALAAPAAEGAKPILAPEANGHEEGSPTAAGAADVAMAPSGLLIAGRDELPEDPDAEPVQDAPETVIAAAASGCAITLLLLMQLHPAAGWDAVAGPTWLTILSSWMTVSPKSVVRTCDVGHSLKRLVCLESHAVSNPLDCGRGSFNALSRDLTASGKHGRKKSGEELAAEVLSHFGATVRGFYTSLAKAIHTPLRWAPPDTLAGLLFSQPACAVSCLRSYSAAHRVLA